MKKQVVVQMSGFTEATPIAHLVQLANQYTSKVYLEMDDKKVNVKSIMGMMSLVLTEGSKVTVIAEGQDEDKALTAMEKFLTA
ncbi:MAG: HPr family phosphocarrier protein [Lachnospiraceae bacterium]|jgi:catabolite repression HPr-like protein|nr:HPr family phosphocarrier protein [Lachnospiraceae bacterium]